MVKSTKGKYIYTYGFNLKRKFRNQTHTDISSNTMNEEMSRKKNWRRITIEMKSERKTQAKQNKNTTTTTFRGKTMSQHSIETIVAPCWRLPNKATIHILCNLCVSVCMRVNSKDFSTCAVQQMLFYSLRSVIFGSFDHAETTLHQWYTPWFFHSFLALSLVLSW